MKKPAKNPLLLTSAFLLMSLSFMILGTASQPLAADELQIEILKADNATLQTFSKDLSIVAGDVEGLSILDDADTSSEDEHPILGEMIPADEYERQIFNVGEYVIICFTPPVTLHIQLRDTAPNGNEGRIFPVDGTTSRKVSGGTRYCIGDENSDTILEMDKNSGTGKGKVWIFGTTSKAQTEAMGESDFSLPEAEPADKPAAGSKMIGKTKVEGWIEYEVQ